MFKSLRSLRLGMLSTLLALAAMLLLAVGASAHTASPREVTHIPAAGAPITDIVHSSHSYQFQPNSMVIYLPHTSTIMVDNTTGAAQLVYDANGHLVVKLMPHTTSVFNYYSAGTYVYHLGSNAKATFTAIVKNS